MILRNYYNMLAAYTLGIKSTDTEVFGDGHINQKITNGVIYPFYGVSGDYAGRPGFGHIDNLQTRNNDYHDYSKTSIMFGTGTTAVTYDDYCLDEITSNISVSNFTYGTPVFDSAMNKYTNNVGMVLTNTGSSSKTITEIGISLVHPYAKNTNMVPALMYREVLTTPFTIAAGESVSYTHNFEFTMPTV